MLHFLLDNINGLVLAAINKNNSDDNSKQEGRLLQTEITLLTWLYYMVQKAFQYEAT